MAWRGGRSDDEGDDIEEEFAGGLDDDSAADFDGDSTVSDADSAADETVPCPACGAEMFEDSPRCPACGEYVPADGSQASSRPLWVFLTAVVCLAMAVWMALVGL